MTNALVAGGVVAPGFEPVADHAFTYGWLRGELVRRVDGRCELGAR